jgi:hypothetical protein
MRKIIFPILVTILLLPFLASATDGVDGPYVLIWLHTDSIPMQLFIGTTKWTDNYAPQNNQNSSYYISLGNYHAKFFETLESVTTFLNAQVTDSTNDTLYSPGIATTDDYPHKSEEIIGLYKVSKLPLAFKETGETYPAYVQHTDKVEKPIHKWIIAPPK